METTTPIVRVEKYADGWSIQSADGVALTDEEAMAITFRATPDQVTMGDFVAVNDAEGTRIGVVSSATYHERAFGPAYVTVAITLR